MHNVMKQRLVGALILVALGVVFWPIIFVEPESTAGYGDFRVPPRPQIDSRPLPAPDDSLVNELPGPRPATPISDAELAAAEAFTSEPADSNAPAAQEQFAQESTAAPAGSAPAVAAPPEPGETRSEAPITPELDAEGLPVAWSLQVVSVSDAERADGLRAELLAMGHKAYIKKVRSGGKTFYRVSIGPKVEKARLEVIRSEVDNKFGVTSMVVRYYP